jgi:adenosylcobinamide kinase/adenosylcobinamide-phosphate guanylyltransferase
MPFVLLLGGARSGKSALAVEMARRSGAPVTFVATAEAGDEEMAERIARHRAERPAGWTTAEAPVAVLDAVRAAPAGRVVVVDCLTLWVANLLGRGAGAGEIRAAAGELAGALAERSGGAVVVSNEVGLGIVPASALARDYRDALGSVNATFAGRAERTALVVAGRALRLAPADEFMEGIAWPRSSRP